jgi:DNA recombination protein RmuC
MELDLFSLCIGLALGLVPALVLFIWKQQAKNTFTLAASEALQQSNEAFLQLAAEKLKQAQNDNEHDLEKRQETIKQLVMPIQKQLELMSGALEQVKGTDRALREDLQLLSKETAKLVGALRNPQAQGQWGEYILEGILEHSGLIKGVHYKTQMTLESGSHRPDAVIHMQDGFNIIIDAKAPITDLAERLSDNLSEQDYNDILGRVGKQVKDHVRALGKKGYWEGEVSPDFTVLFLPSEHLYSMALRADPGLVDYAAGQNIIIASPTLLMSLLRVVGMSWRQVELAKNAQDIAAQGSELYKRLLTFCGHLDKVGGNIDKAMKGYNEAVGSLERSVMPSARKFKELQAQSAAQELPEIKALETTKREINISE